MARCAAVPLLLGLIAAFAAVAVGVAPSGAGVIPSPTGTAALQGLWLREGAAGRVGDVRGLVPALRRCSLQLYLRGAGEDDDEAGEADGGGDAGEMEDGEAGEDEEDSDAGPMTITKAIRQVRLPAIVFAHYVAAQSSVAATCPQSGSDGRRERENSPTEVGLGCVHPGALPRPEPLRGSQRHQGGLPSAGARRGPACDSG